MPVFAGGVAQRERASKTGGTEYHSELLGITEMQLLLGNHVVNKDKQLVRHFNLEGHCQSQKRQLCDY